jgi:nucleotide-binding universal stress UspA family protein
MFHTILVGCDGTEHQADAIALAQQLRDPDQGKLILANVYPFYRGLSGPGMVAVYSDWLAEQAAETLDRAAAHVATGVLEERQTIASPSAAAGLNDLAEAVKADLIVLGGSHRHLAGDLAGRKTVQRLLHGAPCAVAVAVPGQSARFGSASASIVVAYDGSPEAELALDTAYGIARSTHAGILLCRVIEPIVVAVGFAMGPVAGLDEACDAAARAELDEAAGRAPSGVAVEQALLHGVPAESLILSLAENADLVVAGSRAFGALRRAVAGSTSGALLKNTRTPVLVTPRHKVPVAEHLMSVAI